MNRTHVFHAYDTTPGVMIDLRIAMESAPMKDDQKDKSSERNDSIKPEHATHYTNAYDYFLYHHLVQREKTDPSAPHTTNLF